ncbi:MAG: ABC transporter ATP-binding protein [Xanthomonadales bacterium]|nr:ABC transporter ATP-binding protein [Xanthomonadales bacterium]
MSDQVLTKSVSVKEIFSYFFSILGPERNYYTLAVVYGVGISVLSLALPISVQMLVNTVAHTGLTTPLLVLTGTLFTLLLGAGLLNALRIHLMDLFQRRFYARMVSSIALRSVYALNPFFQDYNKGTLFNRYFDILIVQKTVPNLLVGGFAIILQAAVGFVLTSMYHPLFLVFNLVIILFIWLIWLIWGGRAIRSAVEVSHKKHATAAWLEGLGASNGFFKSDYHIEEALRQTDVVTNAYIDRHQKHFRHHFSQTLCFIALYAVASASLLGLGGWLVIQGQLSLGQLVAAELVLSAVFFGLSQLGTYLAYFYELCAALDELSLFDDIEQDALAGEKTDFSGDASLQFVEVLGDARGQPITFNFEIPSGARVMAVAESHAVQRAVTNILKHHEETRGGFVALGEQDIMSMPAHQLRQQIIVLDRPNATEMTIREFLRLSAEGASSPRILQTIRTVGLEHVIAQLEDGLDTRIAATGWPLTIIETMQLKLASAIIARPRVLVLGQLYDSMKSAQLRASLDLLQEEAETTIIDFSSRYRDLGYDMFLSLNYAGQELFDDFDALCRASDGNACEEQGLDTGSTRANLMPAL